MIIKPLTKESSSDVAKIHISALDGDFLTLLGEDFLRTIYNGIIGKRDIYCLQALKNKQTVGFIIGTTSMNYFFKTALKSSFWKLSYYLGIRILKNPYLIKNIFETLLYPQKEQGVKAELVIITVLKKWQGKGIGTKLISALEKEFTKAKIKKYKLTVHASKRAISFYDKLGFIRRGSFNLYNKPWLIYEKKI